MSVVIPVRDPGGLPLVLRGLPPVDEVIVVDSGPASDTAAAVRAARPDALVIRPSRPGAGNALATGVAASRGEVVVTLNGDGSADPAEIPRYVAALTGGADVALGSRYREGGRDLTGGRFRHLVDHLLIWMVNILFGTHRTDPGFGYAAFWRDAIDCLDLPDPSARHGAAWGDGPEIGPLLAVRPEVRGLRVAEVGSVAYPRTRRPARAERAGLRHWIRVVIGEYAHNSGRHSPSHAAAPAPATRLFPGVSTRPDLSAHLDAGGRPGFPLRPASSGRADRNAHPGSRADGRPAGYGGSGAGGRPDLTGSQGNHPGFRADRRPPGNGDSGAGGRPDLAARRGHDTDSGGDRSAGHGSRASGERTGFDPRFGAAGRSGARPGAGDLRGTYGRFAGPTGLFRDGDPAAAGRPSWAETDRRPFSEPIWGPPPHRLTTVHDLWRRGENPNPHISVRPAPEAGPPFLPGNPARPGRRDVKPRSAEDNRPNPAAVRFIAPQPSREVGARRRHLEDYRQRPTLRVINGEGAGGGRSGDLRPLPRRNLGG